MSSSSESNNFTVGRFRCTKGCILYESEQLPLAAQQAIAALNQTRSWQPEYGAAKQRRDGPRFHITIVTHHEVDQLCQHYGSSSVERAVALALESLEHELHPDSPRLLDLGVGHCRAEDNESYYKVICWPDATVWRLEHGLSYMNFHVTVGFRNTDVHSMQKNQHTLIQPKKRMQCQPVPV